MSTPEPTGGPARPARIAGIVLLAVAAIALVMGVISLLPSSGGGNNAGGTSTTPPPATTTTSGPAKPTTTTPAPTTTTSKPAATTTTTSATQPPAGGGGNPQSEPVRVYNNGTIPHLAEQAANDFRSAGYTVPTVGNYSQGIIGTSTVYFRPGTAEEAEANALAAAFHMRSMPRFDGIQQADPGVIVIVTNDYSPPKKG
ncbi:LytR C-terminal domain-containing protein [Kutzneria chonburiensis]|uniref:LytR C-terminal domain-containing protein n=1 Tax=Kutzneria chonburiensis TaxID=1483604 RepID=A0ABV6N2S7_9PSEU|nr:LytR C-terminal domain-containing protein [Kutzneria chonburiensis]